MKIRAYAKINLGLHVLGKRPDGYHSIETVFRLINCYDEIDIVQNDQGVHFTCDLPELASDATNLCVRAAQLLRDLTGIHTGVEISLSKKIPVGAGLGGGSSDAAAVLKGLIKVWSLDISRDELQTVSATLGSDVPFFLTGQTAFAQGRGEILEPIDLVVPYTILTVTPNIHISTAWAYSTLRLTPGKEHSDLRNVLSGGMDNPDVLRHDLINDFEEVVFEHYPAIASLKKLLFNEGAVLALMSGSGSTVFGFFRDASAAGSLARRLSSSYAVSLTDPLFTPDLD